jgi:hypothetical protein
MIDVVASPLLAIDDLKRLIARSCENNRAEKI